MAVARAPWDTLSRSRRHIRPDLLRPDKREPFLALGSAQRAAEQLRPGLPEKNVTFVPRPGREKRSKCEELAVHRLHFRHHDSNLQGFFFPSPRPRPQPLWIFHFLQYYYYYYYYANVQRCIV